MRVGVKDMLEAGVHFGHQTSRWNPCMRPYIFEDRGGIHIINLQKSCAYALRAARFVQSVAASGGRMVMVGTKQQAVEPVTEAAQLCGQFYVTKRWLGGMLTNFQTIEQSISRLKKIDQMEETGQLALYSKKERARIAKDKERLESFLGGIKEMKKPPQVMFVVDLVKERIAVLEARRLGVPVVGLADTNVDPNLVDYPIPSNDDASRSIRLFSQMVAQAFVKGAEQWQEKLRQDEVARREGSDAVRATDKAAATGAKVQTATGGVEVVKVSPKGRKLVAAGLAEEVEMAKELEERVTNSDEAVSVVDTAKTDE